MTVGRPLMIGARRRCGRRPGLPFGCPDLPFGESWLSSPRAAVSSCASHPPISRAEMIMPRPIRLALPLELKFGFRMLVKYPGLTVVGGLAMAFAVWVGAVVFEMVTVFTHPTLPLPDGARVVQIRNWDVEASKGPRRNIVEPKKIVDDSPDCVPQTASEGFDVTVTRIFKTGGVVVRRQDFNTHYIPEDDVTCTHPKAS